MAVFQAPPHHWGIISGDTVLVLHARGSVIDCCVLAQRWSPRGMACSNREFLLQSFLLPCTYSNSMTGSKKLWGSKLRSLFVQINCMYTCPLSPYPATPTAAAMAFLGSPTLLHLSLPAPSPGRGIGWSGTVWPMGVDASWWLGGTQESCVAWHGVLAQGCWHSTGGCAAITQHRAHIVWCSMGVQEIARLMGMLAHCSGG